MADSNELKITLNVGEWLDGPHAVLDKLKSVRSDTVIIDASAPQAIGAQIGQLLLATKKTAAESDGHLKIVNASAEFLNSLDALGISLALEEVIS